MSFIFREYGSIIEITKTQRDPSKVRICSPREKNRIYGARRSDSIYRAKRICVRRVSCALKEYGSPLLLTLTLGGDASDAFFASACLGSFQMWLRSVLPDSRSVFVPELSPRGRIHYHGLIFNVPMHWGDRWESGRLVFRGEERETRYLASGWGAGWLDARQTDGSERLVSYIAKYLTKCADESIFNAQHLIRISQGFPREFIAREEYAEYLFEKEQGSLVLDYVWEGESPFAGSIEKKWFKKVIPT